MHAKCFARLAVAASLAAWISLLVAATAQAQIETDFSKLGNVLAPAGAASADTPLNVHAMFVAGDASMSARLLVTANIAPKWHIYSLTQGGSYIPTKIVVNGGEGFVLTGEFTAAPPFLVDTSSGDRLEQHEGTVTWWAPIKLTADPATITIDGLLAFAACNESGCRPPEEAPFAAKVGSTASAAELLGWGTQYYRATKSPVEVSGHVEQQAVSPGSTFNVSITARLDSDWHIYPLADLHKNQLSQPTIIVLQDNGGFKQGAIQTVGSLKTLSEDGQPDAFYEGGVTWNLEMTVPADAKVGVHTLSGAIGYQTCREGGCLPPVVARFTIEVPVEAASVAGQQPLWFSASPTSYSEIATLSANSEAPSRSRSLLLMLGAALLGGLILNAMPCVLPVIGLKILGFVEQSHDHRSRVFMLNMWFSLGLISVFWVLASLAVFLGLGWGEQFTQPWFVTAMAGLVFVMALSFLGVWEIPIPGFVGSGGAQQLASREGMSGAFAKGVFTTVLATPCSGPFLGPVFGLLLRESPAVVYAVFTCVGLGMASPYLIIGAFPQLIRVLPRPGAWMDTFKQLMAFVLLGTVVYLFTSISSDYFIATFAMLVGLWLGCWWIGRTPLTAELQTKLIGWGTGAAMAAAVGWFSFSYLTPIQELFDWQPYSQQTLAKLTSEGKTVFVDFTANWCPTCKANERLVINTAPIKELVDELGVVTLKADWTRPSDDIKSSLERLNRQSIPVYAIYPADRPNDPLILSDLISKQQLLDTLRKAGKSRTAALPKSVETTAMKP